MKSKLAARAWRSPIVRLGVVLACCSQTSQSPVFLSPRHLDGPERAARAASVLADPDTRARAMRVYSKRVLSFEMNEGQSDSEIRFVSRGTGYSVFLTRDEAVLTLERSRGGRRPEELHPPASESPAADADHLEGSIPAVLRMRLVGANPNPEILGVDRLPGKSHYYIGNDSSKWRTDIANYARVRYKQVYEGVDLVYYSTEGQLEYDLIVAPGRDPRNITFEFEGADGLDINDEGELVLHTSAGEIRQHRPRIYQEVAGVRQAVDGDYAIKGRRRAGFQVGPYDSSRTLVIDPKVSVLEASDVIRGEGTDEGRAIAIDYAGSVYVTGYTQSLRFAGTTVPAVGSQAVFVTKLDSDLSGSVVWSSYLAGTRMQVGLGISLPQVAFWEGPFPNGDPFPSVYVTGWTSSFDFPVTRFSECPGGWRNAFVARIDANGRLQYAVCFGGSRFGADDVGYGIAVDARGYAFVTGATASPDFPTTSRAYQRTYGGGEFDAFVTELDRSGAIVYSTYLGGSATDRGRAIALANTLPIVTGETYSRDFPTAAFWPTFQRSCPSCPLRSDAFVTAIEESRLLFSTFLGGENYDRGLGIAVNFPNSVYVTGSTSFGFPAIETAFQPQWGNTGPYPGGIIAPDLECPPDDGEFGRTREPLALRFCPDAFVAKFTMRGERVYSTYLGGSHWDLGVGIAADLVDDNAWVAGITCSEDFPLEGELPNVPNSGCRPFVTVLNPTGTALVLSTKLQSFEPHGIARRPGNWASVVGTVDSGQQPPEGTRYDVAVTRVRGDSAAADLSITNTASPNPVTLGNTLTYAITVANNGPQADERVRLRVTLPPQVAFLYTSTDVGCVLTGSNVECELGRMASGASRPVNVAVLPTSAGSISSQATVIGTLFDENGPNNSSTAVTKVDFVPIAIAMFGLKVTKGGTGTGTVQSSVSATGQIQNLVPGIFCGMDCEELYNSGTVVRLTAVGDFGSTFAGWSGDSDCLDGTVTMNAPRTCAAIFNGPAKCLYAVSPARAGHRSGPDVGKVIISAPGGCIWKVPAPTDAKWIRLTSANTGSGTGSVTYSVAPNLSARPRSKALSIEGQTFEIGQAGAPCTYSLSATNEVHGPEPDTGGVRVTAPTGCDWTAVSDAIWAPISSEQAGDGQGVITYSVKANTGSQPRTATLTIGGQRFTVTQAAAVVLPLLTISKAGTGSGAVTSNPPGITCGTACSATYAAGTLVTLTAAPNAGSTFAGWTGDADCSDGVVTMSAARSCIATFGVSAGVPLAVTRTGAGAGTVTSVPPGISCGTACSASYATGTLVALTATADAGWTFQGWSGDADCSDGVVTMSAARSCTATFGPIPSATLTLTLTGAGSGTVRSTPAGISCGATCTASYATGTLVTLAAVPDAGSTFEGWSGDADCSDGVVTVSAARSCVARFVTIPEATLTLTKTGAGGGTVATTPAGIDCGATCSRAFALNTPVTLNAIPDPHSSFAGWSGDADCRDGLVTMNAARACTARFVPLPGGGSFDLNRDGAADVFTYQPASGTWSQEVADRLGAFGATKGAWDPNWIIRAAEFNGDGFADLFLYNTLTGVWVKATNNGRSDFTYFISRWDPGWNTYVLDLSGDGRSDVFLYNPLTGSWFKCINVGGDEFQYFAGRWDPGSEIYPTELNGDGFVDLFLYNAASGVWVRATNDGVAAFSYRAGVWDPDWGVFAGNFNGDGLSDLFLYNPASGVWVLAANTGDGFNYVLDRWDPGWMVHVGDLDANGVSDVFLHHPGTGAWVEAITTAAGGFAYFSDGIPWSRGWQVLVTDVNGDRRSDILLYDATTGQWFQCRNFTPGGFAYTTGLWEPRLAVVSAMTKAP